MLVNISIYNYALPQSKDTSLIVAANTGNKAIVQHLLDYQAELDRSNKVWELICINCHFPLAQWI